MLGAQLASQQDCLLFQLSLPHTVLCIQPSVELPTMSTEAYEAGLPETERKLREGLDEDGAPLESDTSLSSSRLRVKSPPVDHVSF